MTSHRLVTASADLHVVDEGEGPAILCLHSLAGSLKMWEGFAASVRDRMRVVRFDARDHGESRGDTGFSVERNADDALAVIDALGLGDCVVMGISMGGQSAVWVALRRPRLVRALIIANSYAGGNPNAADALKRMRVRIDEIGYERFAAEYVASRMARGAAAPGFRAYLDDALRLDAARYLDAFQSILSQDLGPLLPGIQVPTLVLGGQLDVSTPPVTTQGLADGIADARHVVIEEAGHLSCVDEPTRFNDAVKAFVGSERVS